MVVDNQEARERFLTLLQQLQLTEDVYMSFLNKENFLG